MAPAVGFLLLVRYLINIIFVKSLFISVMAIIIIIVMILAIIFRFLGVGAISGVTGKNLSVISPWILCTIHFETRKAKERGSREKPL